VTALSFAAERRTPIIIGVGAVIIAGALAFVLTHGSSQTPPPPPPHVTMVVIQPPKPPPPPPPLPQPKTITPPKMTTPVEKPIVQNQPPKAAPKAPSDSHVSTSIHGNSPNAFDLAGSGNGLGFGNGDGGGGSAMGYYESQMQNLIQQALEKNTVTRRFAGSLQLEISVNASGMVTGVKLAKSSGNPNVDAAVVQNILPGLHFGAPPDGAGHVFPMNMTGEQPL
jgi:protein TonB